MVAASGEHCPVGRARHAAARTSAGTDCLGVDQPGRCRHRTWRGIGESIFEPFVGAGERGGLGLGLGSRVDLLKRKQATRLDPTDLGARLVLSLPVDDWADS